MRTENKEAVEVLAKAVGPLTFAMLLRSLREVEGWSQAELARKLGISRAGLCDVEKGRKSVSPERAMAWATALGESEEQFVALAVKAALAGKGNAFEVTVTRVPGAHRAKAARGAKRTAA